MQRETRGGVSSFLRRLQQLGLHSLLKARVFPTVVFLEPSLAYRLLKKRVGFVFLLSAVFTRLKVYTFFLK